MLTVLRNSWALLLGMMLLMIGNGVQGTLLGIRGAIEGFSTTQMSFVMSAYFLGFLFGSQMTPNMIRRVGHVRVFAALGSMISAVLVAYAAAPDWMAWSLMRVVIGFSFSGVYITAESWLNNASTNETRGQALSMYMIMQMLGIISAQGLLNVGDPSGYLLFVIPSVLVSIAFTPILLTASQAPAFELTKPLSFIRLYQISPLGCVGIFLLGGIFSAQFGMASVWGSAVGLSVRDLSIFVASIYVGGLVLQYPIGWLSDRMDRRKLVLALSVLGAGSTVVPVVMEPSFVMLVAVGALMGGVSNPLYSLLVAYTNDFLEGSDMAAASAGLIFINGVGAIGGPILTGWIMAEIGPAGFFLFIAVLFAMMALYAAWRMSRRPAPPTDHPGAFMPLAPTAGLVAVEAAIEVQAEAQDATAGAAGAEATEEVPTGRGAVD
ncbi:MFS transporter [Defluviimonas sp. WL0024]|uniref:MFS transporter n=2 Tax=Albidovulum TaxID=205889 RepID=A0ABT3IZD1_9RHOB|nr:MULTISPECIES: MFS transporter [Defluviimonas]MCU9849720.1 MFS transporter [Defluviimonas sp. WL0024]MCW3780807.1 MFS transporter [Defluviimonas salinarum]